MSFYNGLPFCCIKSLPLLTTWKATWTTRWTNCQRIPVFPKFQTRNTTSFPKNTRKLHAKDNVANDYTLIYRAPLNNYVTFSQCLGIFSALSVTVSSFFYFYSDGQTDQIKIGSLYLYTGPDDIIGFTALSLCMACGVIIISRKCTLRIYHNPTKSDYVAVFPSVVPFKTTKINFDKAVKDKSKFSFLFKNVNYKLGTKKALLLEHYFKTPINLTEMLVETSK